MGEELITDNLFVDHSLNAAAERFENKDVETFADENNPSEDAELQHYIGVTEAGTNHRLKVREKALKYEQIRMSDRLILPEEDLTFENEEELNAHMAEVRKNDLKNTITLVITHGPETNKNISWIRTE